ncbi:MAG: glycosyltransferase family 39 protein [Proteobacteria bacterium]|nr:glycosyltransferase family 39 protein [Pseudomonadota bacterium]
MLFIINLVQVFLGTVSVFLAYVIFRYFLSEIPSFIATLLTAISPHLISMNTYLLTETLFTFLMMFSLWLLIETYSRNKIIFALIAGIVFASAALTRPTLQYYIIFVVGLIIYQCKLKNALRLILPLILGFSILIAPWFLYNLSVIGKISDSTLAKNTVYHGIYPDFVYNGIASSRGMPYRFDPNSKKISQSYKTIFSEITRRFRKEPYRYSKWYLVDKTLTLFSWDIIGGVGDVFIYPVKYSPYFDKQIFKLTHLFMKSIHWALVILAFISSVFIWTKFYTKKLSENSLFTLRALSLLIFYFIALHIIGAPYPRYSIPLRPVIYGLAIFTCSQCFGLLKEKFKAIALSG